VSYPNVPTDRASAWQEMQSLIATAGGRSMSTDELGRFDALERVVRSQNASESHAALAADFAATRHQPASLTGAGSGYVNDRGESVRVLGSEQRMASLVSADAPDRDLRMSDFVKAIVTSDWSGISPEVRAMSVGSGAGGGFAVPDSLSARVIDKARAQARVLQAGAQTVVMDGATLKLARVAGDPTSAWKLENAAASASDIVLEQVTLTARTLMGYAKASMELIEDSTGIEDVISNAFASSIALELDRAALRGSGTAPEPRGVRFTTGVTVTSLGVNGASLSSYDPLSTAIQTVRASSGEPSAIILSPRTAGALDRLKDSTNQPLRPPPSVEGIRTLVTAQVPENLTQGTSSLASEIYVGQWNELIIGMRQRLVIEASKEASDATDSAFRQLQVHLRAYLRADVAILQPTHFNVITGVL